MTPGGRDCDRGLHRATAADPVDVHEVVREDDALLPGEGAEREADEGLGRGPRQPEGQVELDRQVQVDVEELGPELEGAHVAVEVGGVEAPEDGPLDLGPQLPPHLVEVGVVPRVGHRPGEAAVTVEQRRGVGDGTPPEQVVLGVEGQVDPDVLAPVARSRGP